MQKSFLFQIVKLYVRGLFILQFP